MFHDKQYLVITLIQDKILSIIPCETTEEADSQIDEITGNAGSYDVKSFVLDLRKTEKKFGNSLIEILNGIKAICDGLGSSSDDKNINLN